jgi:preprotein translocase subunit SecG
MLSYLKQQNNETPEDKNTGQGTEAENTKDGESKDIISSSNQSAKRSTYFLCILFVIGIGVLFYMIRESSPQKAKGGVSSEDELRQARIDKAIKRFSGTKTEMSQGIDKVLDKFN